jgi:hypothetical protein
MRQGSKEYNAAENPLTLFSLIEKSIIQRSRSSAFRWILSCISCDSTVLVRVKDYSPLREKSVLKKAGNDILKYEISYSEGLEPNCSLLVEPNWLCNDLPL